MCNIWKIPPDIPSLAVDQWLQLLASPLFSDLRELDITGGEPYLVKDLPELFTGICALTRKNLKSLQSIAITTNGILTRKILNYTEAILRLLNRHNIELVMACAMDAIGPVHDKVRRVKGAWPKVNATIYGLKKLKKEHPNLVLGLKTTILPINIDELDKIVDYAHANDLFTIISPAIITEGRYLNPDHEDDLVFNRQHIEKMLHFYQENRLGWNYHSDHMVRFLKNGTVKKPCTCGFNYFFVRSNGTLFLCPLIDSPIGNIKESTIEELLSSPKASQVRHRFMQLPECRRCTEPGLERFSLPYEGWTYLTALMRMGPEPFLQMHRHMGLDKYF